MFSYTIHLSTAPFVALPKKKAALVAWRENGATFIYIFENFPKWFERSCCTGKFHVLLVGKLKENYLDILAQGRRKESFFGTRLCITWGILFPWRANLLSLAIEMKRFS